MNDFPLVTVYIPAYNHENYVQGSIQSVINQTYPNIEFIIVNDNSTDSTHEKIEQMIPKCLERFKRFEYINKSVNQGLVDSVNICHDWSSADFISGVASDDLMFPNLISELLKEMLALNDEYAIVAGNAVNMNSQGAVLYNVVSEGESYPDIMLLKSKTVFDSGLYGEYSELLKANHVCAQSLLVRKKCIFDVGLYDRDIAIDDWNMWLKLSKKYKFHYVHKILSAYRTHETNTIRTASRKLMEGKLKIFERDRQYCADHGLADLWLDRLLIELHFYVKSSQDFSIFKLASIF
jgi:alpha-1,3-rhamnosyltransferase